jgi:chromosome segregation ATPase
MNQNLVSNLTLRIEQEKQVMQEHQEKIGLFQKNTKSLLNSSKNDLQNLQEDVQNTTANATSLLNEAKQSLISVQAESQKLAKFLQHQTKETANLLNQQAQQLKQLKAQSDQLNNMSQEIAETAKIKKTLFTSNMVLASIALILLILSISLGYVSKSKYNDIKAMENQVNYLKSQGGSMITTTCGGKLCVELDPNVKESYALDNGTRPLGIVREVR